MENPATNQAVSASGLTNPPTKAELFDVYDTSAVTGPRVHDILFEGQVEQITFEPHKPTKMTRERALKFNKDGFTVKDPSGNVFKPVVDEDALLRERLKPDEVIARYDELSADALRARAVVLVGGEKMADATRDELVAFLKGKKGERPDVEVAPTGEPMKVHGTANREGEVSEISAEQMARMFNE